MMASGMRLASKSPGEVDLRRMHEQIAGQLLQHWQHRSAAGYRPPPPERDYVLGLQRLEVLLDQFAPRFIEEFHIFEGQLLETVGIEQGHDLGPRGQAAVTALNELGEKAGLEQRFLDLCAANQDTHPLGHDPVYMLRYLGIHLFESGLYTELFALADCRDWDKAHHRQFGSHSGYLDDLERAGWAASKLAGPGLPVLIRHALLSALIRESGGEVSVDAVLAQAREGSLNSALDRSELIRKPEDRVTAFIGIADAAASRGWPNLASRALEGAESAVALISSGAGQAKAWIDIAEYKAGRGEVQSARTYLDRGLAFLRSSGTRRMPALSKSTGPRTQENWVDRKIAGLSQYTASKVMVGQIAAYCSAVVCLARLGECKKAKGFLTHSIQMIQNGIFDPGNLQALGDCAFRLATLGQHELCVHVIDAIGQKPGLSLVPGRSIVALSLSAGLLTLMELSRRLARSSQFDLALQALQRMGTVPAGAASMRADGLMNLVDLTADPAELVRLSEHAMLAEDKRVRTALLRKLAGSGRVAEGLALSRGRPADLAVLGSALAAAHDARGQAIAEQAIGAANAHRDEARLRALLEVAEALAAGGCCDLALSVWRQVTAAPGRRETDQRAEVATRSAIAGCLARSNRSKEALAMAETQLSAMERTPVLAAAAVALAESGSREQSLDVFDRALDAAQTASSRSNKIDAFESLLHGLLNAREFDRALRTAKALDRLELLDSIAEEPSLVLKLAKDRLARAVGFRPDEYLAIDTAPNHQVEVIRAVAQSGDYRMAREMAVGIDNVSVQQEMLETIAEAAEQKGDISTAIEVLGTLDEDSALMERLRTKAADAGAVGRLVEAGKVYSVGSWIPQFAIDLQLDQHGDKKARERLAIWAETFVDMLRDSDAHTHSMGKWALNAMVRMAAQSSQAVMCESITNCISSAPARTDEHQEALGTAALILAGAGLVDRAAALVTRFREPGDRYMWGAPVACHVSYLRGGVPARAWLTSLKLQDDVSRELLDEIWAAAALGQTGRRQNTEARSSLKQVTSRTTRHTLTHVLTLLETPAAGDRPTAEKLSGELTALPVLLISMIVRSLVAVEAVEEARALLGALPRRSAGRKLSEQASPWFWELLGDRMRQTAESLRRHGQDAVSEPSQDPALALVHAMSVARRQAKDQSVPKWLLDVIRNELTGARKLSGLTAVGQWTAAAYPHSPRSLLVFAQDMLTAVSREGLLDALLCVAGLVPFLYAVGGKSMLAETLQCVCSIRDFG